MNQPEAARLIGNKESFQMALFHIRSLIRRFIIVADHQPFIFYSGCVEIGLRDCMARNAHWIVNGPIR